MNDPEKDLILSRLCDLILHTDCNTDFLTFFQENRILTIFDIESLAAKNEGSERASEFYSIIKTRTNAFQTLLKGLKRTRQTKALEILAGTKEGEDVSLSVKEVRSRVQKLLRDDSISRQSVFFDVDPPVHLFTGRKKELDDLHEMILKSKEGKTMTVISQLATVSGLGGIGKTQLARQYISEKSSFFNENVVWLNAEDQGSLSTSFRRLAAEKLGLSTKDGNGTEKSAKAVAEEVYKYFEGRRALFVFDNAVFREDVGPWLRELFPNPKKNPACFVLMTSRNREWGVGAKVMSLGELEQTEAVSMVKRGLEIAEENDGFDEEIAKLTETLQCFPLALHQAISYIYEQRQISGEYSIETYISEFESTKKEIMLSYRDTDSLDDTYMLTTTTTWKVTVDRIANHPEIGKLAILLLQCMSHYNPSKISQEIFYEQFYKPFPFTPDLLSCSDVKIQTKEQAKEIVNASMRLLVKYSMVNALGEDHRIVTIHRLVQTVTRLQMEKDQDDKLYLFAAFCFVVCDRDNRGTFIFKNIEHIKAIWQICPKTKKCVFCVRNLIFETLEKLYECGMKDEGINFCNEVLIKCKEVFGKENELYFQFKHYKALILDSKGYNEQAQQLLKDMLEETKATFGEQSEIFQDTNVLLADSSGKNGLDKDVELQTIRNAFKWKKTNLGDTHKSTLGTLRILVKQLMKMKLHDEALEKTTDLIKKHKTVCERERDDNWRISLIEAETNVAFIYFNLERKEEALNLFKSVHERFLPIWEKFSFQYVEFCVAYAAALAQADKDKESLAISENCYKILKTVYGNKHLKIPILLLEIGWTQNTLGRLKEALASHLQALESAKAIQGENIQDLFLFQESIAEDLMFLGKIKESFCLLIEAQNQMDTLGISYPGTSKNVERFKNSGNNLVALKLLLKLINSLKLSSTDYSEVLQELSQKMDSIIYKIKTEEKIINICKSALQGAISFPEAVLKFIDFNICHQRYLRMNPDLCMLNDLFHARFLITLNDFKRALQILEASFFYRAIKELRNQRLALSILIAIGDVYFGMKNYDHALAHHNAAYEKILYVHGDLYATTIEAKTRIATDLFYKGHNEESISMFLEITETLNQLVDDNPNTADSTLNMLNYAMKTVSCLFECNNSFREPILKEMQKLKDDFETKVLNEQLSRAEEFISSGSYEKAFEVYKDVYGTEDSPVWKADKCEVASACKNLAHVLNQLGFHKLAVISLVLNLKLVKINLGSEHHWIFLLQGSFATALRGLGKYQKALNLHEEAYQGLLITLDEDHEEMLILKKEIAVDLSFLGRHEESICLFLEVLDKLETISGNEGYDIILAKIELAEAIERQNESLHDAIEILKNLNEIMSEVIDKESPLFQRVFYILSKIRLNEHIKRADELIRTANYTEALKVYEEEVFKDGDSPIWKADINLIALTCKNLGYVLNQLGKHEVALEILEGNLELVKTNLGSEHHWTHLLQGSLADVRRGLGNFQEALKLHNKAYQGLLTTLDENHEDILILRKEIAVDLSLLGRHKESICSFLKVLDKLETTSKTESCEVIIAKIDFAEAIDRSNEGLQDALNILVSVNEVMEKLLDKESVLFQRVSKLINKLKDKLPNEVYDRPEDLLKTENYEEVLKVYKEEVFQKSDGLNYKGNINSFASTGKKVADGLNQMGKHKESLDFLERVIEKVKAEVGNEHPLTFSLMWNLASLHQSQGHFNMAFDIRQKAYKSLRNKPAIKIIL